MQSPNAVRLKSRIDDTFKIGARVYAALGTPFSRSLKEALENGQYDKIAHARIDPSSYTEAGTFARDYLASTLLRKFVSFPLGIDTASAAMEKFLESEESCKKVNLSKVRPYVIHSCGVTPETYISYAKDKIRSLLGKFDWNTASDFFSFSGGASTRLKRKSGAPFYKFQGKPETTRNNALLSICAIWSTPLWKKQMEDLYGLDPCNWVKIVEGSKVTTVPKTALVDRCIAIEPDMNMFIQKGIGAVIRRKLKGVGVDLNDQTHNQRLAYLGSRTGSLSTIDLASASDSIAIELVKLLLPHDWFDALMRCRSEVGVLPCGTKHHFEKISSMGNGYTFELESLIFWALARSVLEVSGCEDRRLGVYGDDIVIHNSVAEVLIEVLDYCGFRTNLDKTFISGPFRESCGKHYFYGEDVTPLYIKEPLGTLNRKFWMANSIRLWASERTNPKRYQALYDLIVKTIEPRKRFLIPATFSSESGLWASFEEARPRYNKRRQCFSLRLLQPRRRSFGPNGVAAVLHWFNGAGGQSRLKIEIGEVSYYPSRTYIPWWDAAPCGVTISGWQADRCTSLI